jgi:hypothetical protein
MYIINNPNNGFIIISADDRTDPILAFSENGSFPDEYIKLPSGIAEWIKD